MDTTESEETEQDCESKFVPEGYVPYSHPMGVLKTLKAPVYKLRYIAVQSLLEKYSKSHNVKSVVEYGCADLKFFDFLAKSNVLKLSEMYLLDIKENKLKEVKHKAEPKLGNYFNKPEIPFKVEITVGSIGRPYYKVKNIDAVIAIEVIEHLHPNVFSAMEYNIFAYMQPKVVILTTPNADFNVLFDDFKGFRDPDHKFEWTRQQFQDWATNIIKRFPNYKANIEGIGVGAVGTEKYGCVSQMVIFERLSESKLEIDENEAYGICTAFALTNDNKPFNVLDVINFPFTKRDDFILEKLGFYINSSLNEDCPFYDDCLDILKMPLDNIVKSFNNKYVYRGKPLTVNQQEVVDILKGANYNIEEVSSDNDTKELFLVFKNKESSCEEGEDD